MTLGVVVFVAVAVSNVAIRPGDDSEDGEDSDGNQTIRHGAPDRDGYFSVCRGHVSPTFLTSRIA